MNEIVVVSIIAIGGPTIILLLNRILNKRPTKIKHNPGNHKSVKLGDLPVTYLNECFEPIYNKLSEQSRTLTELKTIVDERLPKGG